MTRWQREQRSVPDKSADNFAPAKAPGRLLPRGPYAASTDYGRTGDRIVVRPETRGGPVRSSAHAALRRESARRAGRPEPRPV